MHGTDLNPFTHAWLLIYPVAAAAFIGVFLRDVFLAGAVFVVGASTLVIALVMYNFGRFKGYNEGCNEGRNEGWGRGYADCRRAMQAREKPAAPDALAWLKGCTVRDVEHRRAAEGEDVWLIHFTRPDGSQEYVKFIDPTRQNLMQTVTVGPG